jgi:hypothetical protein
VGWLTVVEEEVEAESDLGQEIHDGEDANLETVRQLLKI